MTGHGVRQQTVISSVALRTWERRQKYLGQLWDVSEASCCCIQVVPFLPEDRLKERGGIYSKVYFFGLEAVSCFEVA